MKKSISIVIPCYNSEKYIGKAIESVLNQSYDLLELIVVDDGSTDNSKSKIFEYGDKVKFISSVNLGACNARNLGIESSKNEYLMFLDSDDYLLNDSISAALTEKVDFDILIGDFIFENNNIKSYSGRNLDNQQPLDFFSSWIDGNFIPPCSVIWKKKFLMEIGCWDIAIKRNQDGELVLRALLNNPLISFVKNPIGVYVQHESINRVSKRKGDDIILGDINTFDKLFLLAKSNNCISNNILQSFAKAWYSVAYEAYYLGHDDLGDEALSRARHVGLKGHLGTKKHKIFATILGLKNKMHLSRKIAD